VDAFVHKIAVGEGKQAFAFPIKSSWMVYALSTK